MILRALILILVIFLTSGLSEGSEELFLVYDKAVYQLSLRRGNVTVAEFTAGHGLRSPLPKKRRGDLTTPEGLYQITDIRPSQQYHYFIELSYPNWNDLSWAYFRGELSWSDLAKREGRKLGYAIGIHGGGAFKRERGTLNFHWTQGCIALDNEDLKRLLRLIKPGLRIFIVDSQKGLFEILKKFAYPLQVIPSEFWEGALYLMIERDTFWYFRLREMKSGKRYLLWEEWKSGYQTRKEESTGEGRFGPDLEIELKTRFLQKINNILDPLEEKNIELWK